MGMSWEQVVEQTARYRAQVSEAALIYWKWLVHLDEPLLARQFLDTMMPAVLEDSGAVKHARQVTEQRLTRVVQSWPEYRAEYVASLAQPQQFGDVPLAEDPTRLDAGRFRYALNWLANAAPGDYAIHVLSIGAWDCIVEREFLLRDPRVTLTISDIDGTRARALAADFPGRVIVHEPTDFLDWPRGDELPEDRPCVNAHGACSRGSCECSFPPLFRGFDLILFFEVLEHLPDDGAALRALRSRLVPKHGRLLLSTPKAGAWLLTKPIESINFWGHVRAYAPLRLYDTLRAAGLDGGLYAVDCGLTFYAELAAVDPVPWWSHRAKTLYIPDGASDPVTLARVHQDGPVIVRCKRPAYPHDMLIAHDNVLWPDAPELSPCPPSP